MRQQTLAEGSFEKFRKKTRKELFQNDMEQIIPWQELYGVIQHMQGRNRYCVECAERQRLYTAQGQPSLRAVR